MARPGEAPTDLRGNRISAGGIFSNIKSVAKDRGKKAKSNTSGGRTFAGETGAQADERRAAGFANVRPEQVPITGVQRGNQSRSVGILGAVNSGLNTRGGLAIN